MTCKYGPDAQEGDYVLVLHRSGYGGKDADTFIGKVHNDKVYTGIMRWNGSRGAGCRPVHKLTAECIVPAEYATESCRARIEKDIKGEM